MNFTSAGATASGCRLAYSLDDEPDIRELISNIVSSAGFTARAFAPATSFEMALTEAVGRSGSELSCEAREHTR